MESHLKPIRYGMFGGGRNSFIGHVHRTAARLDNNFELVAGALSSDPDVAAASAADLQLDPARSYNSFQEMAEAESARSDGIEAVVIVTPNHLHAEPAMAFLEAGIHVICDKPLTATLEEAVAVKEAALRTGNVFAVTYCYTGYPMVREVRARIRMGQLGKIRTVHVEYPQGRLSEPLEDMGLKMARWRMDPSQSGPGGCVTDIGTHAYHMARFVSGLRVEELCAELSTFVRTRRVDDDVQVLLRYEGGAKGMLWASRVAPGHDNGLKIRVYGEKAGLEWVQADPNYLVYTPLHEPKQIIACAGDGAGPASRRVARVAAGHPEGYLEAFAVIYAEAAAAVRAHQAGKPIPQDVEMPGIKDGVEGMQFIQACLDSSAANGAWTAMSRYGAHSE